MFGNDRSDRIESLTLPLDVVYLYTRRRLLPFPLLTLLHRFFVDRAFV